MAVQSDTSRIQYTGNNSTVTSYAVPFVFLENSHLSAIAKVTSTGAESSVALTNHTGAGNINGGTVCTAVAVPATSTLTISRTVPATQTTQYQEGGDFPAASHERALDKLTMAVQQVARAVARSIQLTDAAPDSLPLASIPSRYFGTDDTGAIALISGTDSPAGTLTNANIASDAAIVGSKLADASITANTKLIDGTITTSKLTTGAVTDVKLATNAVTSIKILDGNVTAAKILTGAVTAIKIAAGAITPDKLNGGQSGSAPIYGCRAFVNFDGATFVNVGGEDRCTLRAAGNVSKVVRTATGNYVVHFTTAMADANYSIAVSRLEGVSSTARSSSGVTLLYASAPTAASFSLETRSGAGTATAAAPDDATIVCAQVFQ